jgi:ribonuclease D
MNAERLPEPILIQRPVDLHKLAERLCREGILAVDTESNSLFAYQEQVCLIQFSTPEMDYLVDPLALEDLSPLGEVFSAEGTEKVFHAAEYDLICLSRDFGFEFANLFDTMVAARILGRKAVGLGSLLEAEFKVHLEKRYQRANWGQRPLPPHLLNYARLDTHYLIALRERLYAELERRDLLPLAEEDFGRLSAIHNQKHDNENKDDKLPDVWRIRGARDLHPRQAAVLKALCDYRDQTARGQDRPLFKVLSDQTLVEVARNEPSNLDELSGLEGMNKRQLRRYGAGLLQAVRQGHENGPLYPPHNPRPDESFLERLDALREWRKYTARKRGVPSDVVLPRDLMIALAERAPDGMEELEEVLSDVPWRVEHFGQAILYLLSDGRI